MQKLLILSYVNNLDSNISNATGIKATHFAYETTILFTFRETHDLVFNIDVYGNILPWFHKKRLIINKDKPLTLD